jgi:hypothetical protein
MCLNCGCNQPNERHGNDANITAEDVRRAGEANGQDLATTVANMRSGLGSLAGSTTEEPAAAVGDLPRSAAPSMTRTPR